MYGSTRTTAGFMQALGQCSRLVDMPIVPGLRWAPYLPVGDQPIEVSAYADQLVEKGIGLGHGSGSENAKARTVAGFGTRAVTRNGRSCGGAEFGLCVSVLRPARLGTARKCRSAVGLAADALGTPPVLPPEI